MPKIDHFDDKGLQKFKENLPKHPPTYQEMEKASINHLKVWTLHLLIDELEDILEAVAKSEELPECDIIELTTDRLQFSPLLRVLPDTDVEGEVKTFFLKNVGDISTGVYEFLCATNPYVEMNRNMAKKNKKNNKKPL